LLKISRKPRIQPGRSIPERYQFQDVIAPDGPEGLGGHRRLRKFVQQQRQLRPGKSLTSTVEALVS